MYKDSNVEVQPEIDFVAHAASMGAHAEKAVDIADLEARIVAARDRSVPSVIVINTDAVPGTGAGGHWWGCRPQVGGPERLEKARERYHENAAQRRAASSDHGRSLRLRSPPNSPGKDGHAAATPQGFGTHGKVHEIRTQPRRGGATSVSLWRLCKGDIVAEATGSCEVILVMIGDKAHLSGAGHDWGVLGERMDVFEERWRPASICPTAQIGEPSLEPTVR